VLAVFIPLSLYLPYWYYKTVKTLRGHAIQLSEKNAAMPATLAAYQRTNPAVALLLLLSPTILGFVLFVALGPAHYSWLRMIGPAIPVLTLLFFAALFRDIVLISSPGVAQQEGEHRSLNVESPSVGSLKVESLSVESPSAGNPSDRSLSNRILAKASHHPNLTAASLCISMASFWILSKCGGPFFLLFTLSCLPLAVAQHWLNSYWRQVEPSQTHINYAFNPVELICIIAGSLYMALIVINFSIKH